MKVDKVLVDGKEEFVHHWALHNVKHYDARPEGVEVYEVEYAGKTRFIEKAIVDAEIYACKNPMHEVW
jgi:hypothetical protein